MKLFLLIFALLSFDLSSADQSSVPKNFTKLCKTSAIHLSADVVRTFDDSTGHNIIVDNSKRDVEASCSSNDRVAELIVEDVPKGNHVRLWEANEFTFWKGKSRLRCGECHATVIEIKNDKQFRNNCSLTDGLMLCSINDWKEEASKEKHNDCPGPFNFGTPSYKFEFFDADNSQWIKCDTLQEDKIKADKIEDTSLLSCNTSGIASNDGSLIIRMERSHKSTVNTGLPFLQKEDGCKKQSYFLVKTEKEPEVWFGTVALIGLLVVSGLVIIGLVCYLMLRRKQAESPTSSQNSINKTSLIDKTKNIEADPKVKDEPRTRDDPGFLRQCSIRVEADTKATHNKISDETKQKIIFDSVFHGDGSKVNPHLPVCKQSRSLHYDRKYDRTKDSFKIGYVLGEGMFGTVFVGSAKYIYGPQETKIAVKQVRDLMDENQISSIIGEMKIMSNLKMHPNLVNLLGACRTELYLNELYLLLEYCPYGDLKTFLVDNRSKFGSCLKNIPGHLDSMYNSRLLFNWCYSIAKGLEYLSSASIMHGDLAARNILIGDNYVAKVSDFGLSKMLYYREGELNHAKLKIPKAINIFNTFRIQEN